MPFGISVINAPVTFNGGAASDVLNVGSGGLHAVSGLVTYNAGALSEGNVINLYDGANPFFVDYLISETSITRSDPFFFGGVNYSGVRTFSLDATQGPNTVTISASSINSATVTGNGGDDTFVIGNGNNLAGGIGLFTGNGGEGFDRLTLNDSLSTHDLPWAVLGNGTFDPQTIYLGLQAYDLEGYEAATVLAGNGNNNFQINGTMAQAVALNAGGGNDTVELNNVSTFRDFFDQDENPPFNHLVTIDGGGGFNALIVDDAAAIDRSYVISPTHMTAFEGAPLGMSFDYDSFQSVTVQAGNYFNDFLIFGTSSDLPSTHQMTILGGPEPEYFEVRPHDDQGNLTINGNLGIGGGGGADSLVINDSASSLPINYSFYNQFGPGTTNIGGLGAAGFGAGSNIENITVLAGSGDDVFDIHTFQSGSGLTINAGAGSDRVNITPLSKNLTSNITSIASFNYIGGDGGDFFNLYNDNHPQAWTYTRTAGFLRTQNNSSGYFAIWNQQDVEYLDVTGGTLSDTFLVQSTPTGTFNTFRGAGGNDSYALGLAGRTNQIVSNVAIVNDADTDFATIDNSADTVGRIAHVDEYFVGGTAGDNLFGPGGYLYHVNLAGQLSLTMGSGADTVYAAPNVFTQLSLAGGSPSGGAAGSDLLGFAFADAENPVLETLLFETRRYIFDNRCADLFLRL